MDSYQLRSHLQSLWAENPQSHPCDIARLALQSITNETTMRNLALRFLEDKAGEVQRAETRKIESRATRPAKTQPSPAAPFVPPPKNTAPHRSGEGCGCQRCEDDALIAHQKANPSPLDKALSRMKQAIDELTASIRLEVTEELLASSFALGDGRRVTWAEATVEDHETRIKLLQTNAVKNIETASKHQAAISMLEEANAPTLGALQQEAA